MKHLSVLIKPFSSVCNIRCKYCFYEDVSNHRSVKSFGKMSLEVAEQMIQMIFKDLDAGDHLTIAFQGGEPTLAGLPYFEQVLAFVEKELQQKTVFVHYSLQTNGIIINERWCRFLKEHQFLVGLSIDGNPIYHDLYRLDMKGRGTFQRVLKTKKLFEDYGIEFNVLCVLTNDLAAQASKVYHFIQREDIRYIQFIPCLDSLDAQQKNSYALTPQRFYHFYKKMFQFWSQDLKRGKYRSIKLFDDVYHLFVRGEENFCGIRGRCQVQYVIESDGSVYPCDFYVLDQYRMGMIQENSLREMFTSQEAQCFLRSRSHLPEKCHSCPVRQWCNGGCKRMLEQMYVDVDKDYCGYQQLLTLLLPKTQQVLEWTAALGNS